MRAPAGSPANPPAAPAGYPTHDDDVDTADSSSSYASERDTAGAIAVCRAGYAVLASQLNQILDIEDARQK